MRSLPRGELGRMAKALGVHPTVVSRWKSGLATPAYDSGFAVVAYLREGGFLE